MEGIFQAMFFSIISSHFSIWELNQIIEKLHDLGAIVPIFPIFKLDPTPEDQVVLIVRSVCYLADNIFEGLIDPFFLGLGILLNDVPK